MIKAQSLMIQGTTSDAGKSVLTTALCRIFARKGYRTAPFKSQNMALNSYITLEGKEIGRAQGVQAEAAGIAATTDMNPILIKPSGDYEAQIVVHGRPLQTMKAGVYRGEFHQQAKQIIHDAYMRLSQEYERIVIEGAGSPAEINLNDRELVNMHVARLANAPVILVADIDRGGVFASLVGTLQLLEAEDRNRVIGVVINKFRGDISLLQPGLTWFEEYTGKRVLGVLPYMEQLLIDAEDSLALHKYKHSAAKQNKTDMLDVAIVRLPRISNFTDLDPLFLEEDCSVRFVSRVEELGAPDLLIIPGTKNTIEDMLHLQKVGLSQAIQQLAEEKRSWIFGICGGYQILGTEIIDQHGVESKQGQCSGLGLLPIVTELAQTKRTTRTTGQVCLFEQDILVRGYEIHMGQSRSTQPLAPLITFTDTEGQKEAQILQDGAKSLDERIIGTYFHGIFHNDTFRAHVLNHIRKEKGWVALKERINFRELQEMSFDDLATIVEEHIDLDYIEEQIAIRH